MTRKPDFFLVGTAKAGTSSLYNYLVQHPSVFMTEPKEPHFFSEWRPSVEEVKGMEEYLNLFRNVPDHILAGEASTSYLYSSIAAEALQRFRPDAKIMIVLRDPVSRAYSQYWNQVQEGVEPLSFEEALEAEPRRIEEGWWYGFHYAEVGRYADQITRYLDLFGPESVRIYLLEDLIQDPQGVCGDVFEFLGVDARHRVFVGEVHNRGGAPKNILVSKMLQQGILLYRFLRRHLNILGKEASAPPGPLKNVKDWMVNKNSRQIPKMDSATEARLRRFYKDNVLRLESLLGRDLSRWRA